MPFFSINSPFGGDIRLTLCQWNAYQVFGSNQSRISKNFTLDKKTISCPRVGPVACTPSTVADEEGVDKVSSGEPSHFTHPHVFHVHRLFGEVVNGHVDVLLKENRLHPGDISCVVVDNHLQHTNVKIGLTVHEYS